MESGDRPRAEIDCEYKFDYEKKRQRMKGVIVVDAEKCLGCKSCRNTGFRGRIGFHELLVVSDQLRDAIVSSPSIGPIRKIAVREGMVSLTHDGFRKVREGITTVEEVLHIAGDVQEVGAGVPR